MIDRRSLHDVVELRNLLLKDGSPAVRTIPFPTKIQDEVTMSRLRPSWVDDDTLRCVAPVEAEDSLLGKVSASVDGLLSIRPERRELAQVGTMLGFSGGGSGVIIAERCGLYFAASLSGGSPEVSEAVTLLPANLTVAAWDGSDASWGGRGRGGGRVWGHLFVCAP